MRNLRLKALASVVVDYIHLFVNRRAYTIQSDRPHPESARLPRRKTITSAAT
jgi:hypothetical protein